MAEKFSGSAYSLIGHKELRCERTGLLTEVHGEAESINLELVRN